MNNIVTRHSRAKIGNKTSLPHAATFFLARCQFHSELFLMRYWGQHTLPRGHNPKEKVGYQIQYRDKMRLKVKGRLKHCLTPRKVLFQPRVSLGQNRRYILGGNDLWPQTVRRLMPLMMQSAQSAEAQFSKFYLCAQKASKLYQIH